MLAKAFQNNSHKLFSSISARCFASKATQKPLPYDLNALEPVISATLMDHHYNHHHKTYVTKYNETLDQLAEAQSKDDHAKVSRLGQNLKFFGGGNYNHTFFWESLAPTKQGGGALPGKDALLT